MALTPLFNCVQSSGLPNRIVATDSSTGSDVNITQRRIFLLKADGTYLVPTGTSTSYVQWAYASTSINLDVLTSDTALSILVQWLDVSNTVLYTKTIAYGFSAYGETFYYGLTQGQIAITNPALALSFEYYRNKMLFRVYLDSASQAISFASDIYAAQTCYNLESQMIVNQANLF